MNTKEIISSYWFSEMGSSRTIGIVKVNNGQKIKYYIGTGEGQNQQEDEQRIMMYGAKFPENVGGLLIP